MKYTASKRQAAGQRRKPPVMREIPPTIFDVPKAPPDPKIIYYVRTGEYTVEIATAEDWHMLAAEVIDAETGCHGETGLEVWAGDEQMATLIYPNPNPFAVKLMRAKFEASKPQPEPDEIDPDDDLFAPDFHPGLTFAQAEKDFERVYRERMGQGEFHPTPEGPVMRGEAELDDKFRSWCNDRGIPVTETPEGPAIISTHGGKHGQGTTSQG